LRLVDAFQFTEKVGRLFRQLGRKLGWSVSCSTVKFVRPTGSKGLPPSSQRIRRRSFPTLTADTDCLPQYCALFFQGARLWSATRSSSCRFRKSGA
jgi:hypothetical protein